MQTTDVPPPGGATPPPPPPPSAGWTSDRLVTGLKALRRSRSDRILGGVCGGLGHSLGLDPLLIRVVVAVLTIFGGAGLVLYAAAWLLLPEDDGRRSIADRAFRGAPTAPGHPSAGRPVLSAIALVVIVVIAALIVVGGWDGTLLLVLALVALFVWLDRRPERAVAFAPPPYPYPPTGYADAEAPPTGADVPTAPLPPSGGTPPSPTGAYPTGPYGTPPGPPTAAWPVPAPVPPRPPRPRSVLLPATLSVGLIALGVLGAVDGTTGVSVPSAAYPALALAVVGLGLLVGARYGRSRLLIVVGLLLAVATSAASAVDRFDVPHGGDVNQVVRPALVAAVPASAGFRTGSVTYDLSGLDFGAATATTAMDLSIGAGEIVVVVPEGVDVTVRAEVGAGEVDLLGRQDSGVGLDSSVRDDGLDGPGGGTVDLTLRAGVGNLEVRRG